MRLKMLFTANRANQNTDGHGESSRNNEQRNRRTAKGETEKKFRGPVWTTKQEQVNDKKILFKSALHDISKRHVSKTALSQKSNKEVLFEGPGCDSSIESSAVETSSTNLERTLSATVAGVGTGAVAVFSSMERISVGLMTKAGDLTATKCGATSGELPVLDEAAIEQSTAQLARTLPPEQVEPIDLLEGSLPSPVRCNGEISMADELTTTRWRTSPFEFVDSLLPCPQRSTEPVLRKEKGESVFEHQLARQDKKDMDPPHQRGKEIELAKKSSILDRADLLVQTNSIGENKTEDDTQEETRAIATEDADQLISVIRSTFDESTTTFSQSQEDEEHVLNELLVQLEKRERSRIDQQSSVNDRSGLDSIPKTLTCRLGPRHRQLGTDTGSEVAESAEVTEEDVSTLSPLMSVFEESKV